ncbi:MAG: RNA polymerase sigma factor [Gammaproteobacteria bacterium]
MAVGDPTQTLELPAGAERDLDTLFVRHAEELRVYLTGQVRCSQTAADLVQDTFVRLAQQRGGATENNPRAYLYRVAQNLAIDHYRSRERRQTDPTPHEDLLQIADEAPLPERAVDGHQRLAALQRTLMELPELTQRIFQLNRIEGLTYSEIARRLDISDSSVQKHLSRALQHAMRCLRQLGES